MSDIATVSSSVVPPPAAASADGPKYNEDVTLLEEGSEEPISDATASEEEEEIKVTLPAKDKEEEEEEDEESLEEKPESATQIPFDRPTVKELKAKYPDLFKDFPTLKEAYFRELEFTKLFPTVDDAKEAFEDNEAFNVLTESTLAGDPAPLLDSVEKADTKALELLSLSFLPTLYKKSQDLYVQAVNPIFQNLVRTLFADKDENTRNAGLVLAEYLFGSDGEAVAKSQKSVAKVTELTEAQKQLKEQKDQTSATSFRASAGKVQDSVTKNLETLVLKDTNFDPNEVFSPFLRKQGAQEVIKRIMKQLESDKGHMSVMAARWKRARANGYTGDDESKIISTYLARAKSLIPDACSKVSAAMLGTKTKAADNKREQTRSAPKENNSGWTGGSNGGGVSARVDYSKMSDVDILGS